MSDGTAIEKGGSGGERPQRGNRIFLLVAVFLAAFPVAFAVAWYVLPRSAPPPASTGLSERILTKAEMADFFAALEREDFPEMSRLGEELFAEGTTIPGSREIFSDFETNTYSNFYVYVLHLDIAGDKTVRVLLTMDEKDRVDSFLAEEMTVTR